MRVVGYTIGQDQYHKECVSGLIDENRDTVMIVNGETIEVTPMFDIQDEYDCYPICEECKQYIEDVQLTNDGIDWLNEQGKKTDWQSWSDIFPEDFKAFFDAYYGSDGNWHCLDCFCEYVLQGDSKFIAAFREHPENCEYLIDCISDTSKRMVDFPEDYYPEGVTCHECGSELYAPLELEESET